LIQHRILNFGDDILTGSSGFRKLDGLTQRMDSFRENTHGNELASMVGLSKLTPRLPLALRRVSDHTRLVRVCREQGRPRSLQHDRFVSALAGMQSVCT